MIAILLSPLYVLINLYTLHWLLCWTGTCHSFFRRRRARGILITAYTFLASSVLTAFLLPPSGPQRILQLISNYWLGVFLYIVLTVAAADLIRNILLRIPFRHSRKLFCRKGFILGGAVSVLVILALSVMGIAGAANIRVTDYQIKVDKRCGELEIMNIVLVADWHLGYSIGSWHMERMVEEINRAEPDLVVVAGDIFDNEYEALDDPERLIGILSGIRSRFGVYACYGNHDIDEKLLAGFTLGGKQEKRSSDPRMDEFLERAGIRLLRDEGVLVEGLFYLYGRPDAKKPGLGTAQRKESWEITRDMDRSKPIIVIDHQPRELQELADAGVDLDLCGHTHDGQMFPGNLAIRLMWENPCGYMKKDEMHNIVTSGVGVFGPNMRVGTKSEICRIQVTFKSLQES